ncbi:MAG: response regulator [Calditrichaeota bacterium]|nr:response regulator [Calditrichota bacterium]
MTIEHLSLEDGLSQSSIYSIIQDSQGFMWFGTEDGLNKYDGYSFSVLKNNPTDTNSLSHNSIYSICEGKPGVLWIGTWDGGLNKYDSRIEKFTRYMHDPTDSSSISSNIVYSVISDKNGNIWVGTENGLNKLGPAKETFKRFYNDPKDKTSLADNAVYRLLEDSRGNIWVGGYFDGLSRYNAEDNSFEVFSHNPMNKNSLSGNSIFSLANDLKDNTKIWIGTIDGGLDRLDINNGNVDRFGHVLREVEGFQENEISTIISDTTGYLWVGTSSIGLILLSPEIKIVRQFKHDFSDKSSLAVNDIYSLYRSNSDLFWVGTNGGGLHKLGPINKQFNLYRQNLGKHNILNSNMISSILEDDERNLWISSWESGISIINRDGKTVRHLLQSDDHKGLNSTYIFMLYKTKNGRILVATDGGGLNIYDPKTKKVKYIVHDAQNENSLLSDIVMSVFEDQSGFIWIGYYDSGVSRLNLETNTFKHFINDPANPNTISGHKIYTIFEDGRKYIWFAVERNGLSRYDPEKDSFKNYKHDENDKTSLSNDDVISIYQDSESRLWFGTYGGGLNRFDYDSESFVYLKESEGLPNDVVYGILEDEENILWISTNRGLSRFNPKKNSFRNYDVHDGLQSNEFNSAFYKSADGELFFGGINGLNSFFPKDIKDNKYIPPVLITKFLIHNKTIGVNEKIDDRIVIKKAIPYLDELHIEHSDNVISFEFAALNYFHSHKNQYTYKMVGFDQNWSPQSNRRFTTYSNLPPGEYMFKVKGSNNDGVWNEKETSIKVIVEPAYWQTWWFIALIVVISVILLFAAHLYRLHGISEKNKQLKLEVEERINFQKQVVYSEKRFKQLSKATFEAILISDFGKIVEVNQSAIDMFGYSRDEFLKLKSTDLSTSEYRELIEEKIINHDSNPYKAKSVKKDGTVISVEIRGKQIIYDNKVLVVTAITDITEKLHAENHKKDLEKQLLQAQKMEAIGNLAGGVAHDFNNLITIINGFAELGVRKIDPSHSVKRDFDQIISASDKASQLTRQLLALSRKQTHKPEVLDINKIIVNLEKMISRLISADITINKNLHEDLPLIFADPGQIEQILLNLLVNSRDAIEAKADNSSEKQISISTSVIHFDRTYTASHIESSEGMHVCLEIVDNGAGMTEDVRQKVFEPFFTTKAEGKGTGLGLATVYGIVKQNDANISVESELGEGTSVKIYWPSTEEVFVDSDPSESDINHLKGEETVLLVEDDDGVRSFASSSLKSYGYKVYSARNGNEALEMIEKDKLIFDILVSDMIMPGMNGKELSRELLKRDQNLKYLIISGYSNDYISQDGVLEEGINFLQKPFSVSSLVEKVRTILDKK